MLQKIGINDQDIRKLILKAIASRPPTLLMKIHDQHPDFDHYVIKEQLLQAGVTDDLVEELDETSLEKVGICRQGDRMRILKALRSHSIGMPIPHHLMNNGKDHKTRSGAQAFAVKSIQKHAVRTAVETAKDTSKENCSSAETTVAIQTVASLSVEEAMKRLHLMGVCKAGYSWLQVPDDRLADGSNCDCCQCILHEGFNCQAGGHWICWNCVEDFIPED